MSEPLATVEARHDDGKVVVTIGGEIDLSNAVDLDAQIEKAIRGAGEVVVDLQSVQYLDSRGVRLLHALSQRLEEQGVPLRVVAPAGTIAGEILRLTHLPGLEVDGSSR
jgi:anti-sigma B factor antagonist